MAALLCFFAQCRWVYIADATKPAIPSRENPIGEGASLCGVYQCSRCKTVSIGSPRVED
jgi:hypothetical protein